MTQTELFYLALTLGSGLLFLIGILKRDARAVGFGGLVIVGILLVAILRILE